MRFNRRQLGGMLLSSALVPVACRARPRGTRVLGVVGQGQSNMLGELAFSQRHRVPDVYDPVRDGSPRITGTRTGIDTPSVGDIASLTASQKMEGARVYPQGASETPLFGFCDQLLRYAPGQALCASVAGSRGGAPLSVLRRPTCDEIANGMMIASDRNVPIPPGSLEQEWFRGTVSLRDLWQSRSLPATPWFGDARSQSIAVEYFRRRQQRYDVAYMPMQHGETLSDEPYLDALCAFYDEKQACWREITGQEQPALLVMELANYASFHELSGLGGFEHWRGTDYAASAAPGGSDSRYAPEAQRFNMMFKRNLEQVAATGRGERRIIVSNPKYPVSSLIHHDQYGSRWAGEMMAHHAIRADGGRTGALLGPIKVDRQGDTLVLRFDRSIQLRAPSNGRSHEVRQGYPYGLGLFTRNGQHIPLPLAAVRAEGSTRRIVISSVPPEAMRLEYVGQARVGSICATTTALLIGHDRDGSVLPSFDYCCPFERLLPPR